MNKKGNNKLILYHGSNQIISNPQYGKGRNTNDYGRGFYCTEHPELAGEWACGMNTDGYVNKYSINSSGLKILNLNADDYSVLNWLAVLLRYRMVAMNSPLMQSAREYICEKYYLDLSGYDIIRGYRADDSYFSFVRAFVSNSISLEQLSAAMHLGNPGEQIVIKSTAAFDRLKFIDAELASREEFYVKKAARDIEARNRYLKITEAFDAKGTYVSQLVSGEAGDYNESI